MARPDIDLAAKQDCPSGRAVAAFNGQWQTDELVRPRLDSTQVDALKDDDTGLEEDHMRRRWVGRRRK